MTEGEGNMGGVSKTPREGVDQSERGGKVLTRGGGRVSGAYYTKQKEGRGSHVGK